MNKFINYIFFPGTRFFQGYANYLPELSGLLALYAFIKNQKTATDDYNIAFWLAIIDAIAQGLILALSELEKRLSASTAPGATSLKSKSLVMSVSLVTGVISFDGVQDFLSMKGSPLALSASLGALIGVGGAGSAFGFLLDRTIRAQSLAYWPNTITQRAKFLFCAIVGNISQALINFYQLYRFLLKCKMPTLGIYIMAGLFTALVLYNNNQNQTRIMGHRLVRYERQALGIQPLLANSAPPQAKFADLSYPSQVLIAGLNTMNLFNLISAPGMLLMLLGLCFSPESLASHRSAVFAGLAIAMLAGAVSAYLTYVFRMPSVMALARRADNVVEARLPWRQPGRSIDSIVVTPEA